MVSRMSDEIYNGALFRVSPMRRFDLGNSSELVYFSVPKRLRILPSNVVRALHSCVTLKPLSDHAASLAPVIGASLDFVRELRDAGMFVSYDELVAPSIRAASSDGTSPLISYIAIPTRGRPEELRNVIASYVDYAQRFSRNFPFFVAEGSSSLEDQQTSREIVRALSRSSGMSFWYCGLKEKLSYVRSLTNRYEIPREVMEFAFVGPPGCRVTTGANRNTILAHTLGHSVLSVDDDSLCQVGTVADGGQRRLLSLRGDSADAQYWCFQDRASACKFAELTEVDIAAEHEQLLGKTIASLVSAHHDGLLRIDDPCSHLVGSLLSAEGGVAVTFSGVAGDSGLYSSGGITMERHLTNRQRLMSSEQVYRGAVDAREIVRQVLSKTICHAGAPMTTATGLDNRGLLPPFFPSYRNQDNFFALTIKRCIPDAFFGHIPWSLVHTPSVRRNNHSTWAATVRFSDVVQELVSTWPEPRNRVSSVERLVLLGQHLIDSASLSDTDFAEAVRLLLLNKAAQTLRQQEARIRQFSGRPDFWARDLNSKMESLRRAVSEPTTFLPKDMMDEISPADVLPTIRKLVTMFGQLLCWWPDIMRCVTELSNRGKLIGRKIE